MTPIVDLSSRTSVDVPPQNREAEESVLGAMLVTSQALRAVRVETGLVADHFYLDSNREIFSAIGRVAERDGIVDELLVGEELPQHRMKLSELAARVPAAGNAVHYARIVVEKAAQRSKIDGAQMIREGALEGDEDLVQQGLQLAAADASVDAERTGAEEIMDELFDWLNDPADPEVFELPWPELNESVLGGFRRKQMSVLAGWPKFGKSIVLDKILTAFAAQGKRCAIFAYEVSRHERAVRHVTFSTGISSEKIMRKQLDATEMKKVVRSMHENPLPFDYFEAAGWSVNRVAQRIIYGGYDVVAVDPVSKIPGFEKTENASAAVGRLTEVATRADCHVILVSHLNRGRGTTIGGVRPRPTVSDLRGSGMLEGDAHAVMFLHRDQDDEGRPKRTGEIYIDRSRMGPPSGLKVMQLERSLQFVPFVDDPNQQTLDVGSGKEPRRHDREEKW
jgi:replicative DNA helicase